MGSNQSPIDENEAPDGWSDLSEEERTELRQEAAAARENVRNGVPGIPLDEVLPRYRQAG
jgi:hypothetical protein